MQRWTWTAPYPLTPHKHSIVQNCCIMIVNFNLLPGQAATSQCFQAEQGLVCIMWQNSDQTAVLHECIYRPLNISVRFDEPFLLQQKGALEYTEKSDWLNGREFSLVWWLAFFPRVILSWIAWFLPVQASQSQPVATCSGGSAAEMEWLPESSAR